jgi:peptide deformylase
VRDFGSTEVQQTRADLEDTLRDLQRVHGKGGGLAAPQIGASLRVVYLNARGRSFHLINPVITERSEHTFQVWDFCFSARAAFLAQVERSRRIRVKYRDIEGQLQDEVFEGYFSELLQHEIDHLGGVLFIDHIRYPSNLMMVEEWDKYHVYSQ